MFSFALAGLFIFQAVNSAWNVLTDVQQQIEIELGDTEVADDDGSEETEDDTSFCTYSSIRSSQKAFLSSLVQAKVQIYSSIMAIFTPPPEL